VAPYPLGGNPGNTSTRLQATAEQANISILAVQAVGTGRRAFIDLFYGATNKRSFGDECQLDASEIRHRAKDYDRLVGWGDSRAATNIMRMQQDTGMFERVLLRDGINFESRNAALGVAQFVRYQMVGERNLPLPEDDMPPPSDPRTADKYTGFNWVAEIANYSRMLAGEESETMAIGLAQRPELPMQIMGVTHSFSGSKEVALKSLQGLREIRQKLTDPKLIPAELATGMIEGGHSALLRPGLAAEHIGQTLALQTVMYAD